MTSVYNIIYRWSESLFKVLDNANLAADVRDKLVETFHFVLPELLEHERRIGQLQPLRLVNKQEFVQRSTDFRKNIEKCMEKLDEQNVYITSLEKSNAAIKGSEGNIKIYRAVSQDIFENFGQAVKRMQVLEAN